MELVELIKRMEDLGARGQGGCKVNSVHNDKENRFGGFEGRRLPE